MARRIGIGREVREQPGKLTGLVTPLARRPHDAGDWHSRKKNPMDFSPTDYQRQLKATAHEFMERECPRDRLLELGKTDTGHDAGIWRKAADIGFLGALIPESYGGAGGSLTDAAMICEEFGRGPLPGPYFHRPCWVISSCRSAAPKARKLNCSRASPTAKR